MHHQFSLLKEWQPNPEPGSGWRHLRRRGSSSPSPTVKTQLIFSPLHLQLCRCRGEGLHAEDRICHWSQPPLCLSPTCHPAPPGIGTASAKSIFTGWQHCVAASRHTGIALEVTYGTFTAAVRAVHQYLQLFARMLKYHSLCYTSYEKHSKLLGHALQMELLVHLAPYGLQGPSSVPKKGFLQCKSEAAEQNVNIQPSKNQHTHTH